MDPIVTVLVTTAAGALVGTCVGVLLMHRQLRPLISESDLAELKGNLQRSETALAAATVESADLGKQIALRDKAIGRANEDVRQKQEQLDRVLAEAHAETLRRSAAEEKVQDLSAQRSVLTDQCTRLDARAGEQEKQLAERATQIGSLQSELGAAKRHAEELKELLACVSAEAAELRSSKEQEGRYRSSLEAQLRAEQEQIEQLNKKMAELQNDRAQLEVRLLEERRSAARGMELLVMAQEKLSSVFKPVALDAPSENGRAASVAPSNGDADLPAKVAGAAQSDG